MRNWNWWQWTLGGIGLLVVVVLIVMVVVAYTGLTEEPVATPVEETEEKVEEVEVEDPSFTLITAPVTESDSEGFYLRYQSMGKSGKGTVWFEVIEPDGEEVVSSSFSEQELLPEQDVWYPARKTGEYKIKAVFQGDDGGKAEGEEVKFHFSP